MTNWSLAAPSAANLTPTLSGSSTDRSVIVKSVLFSRMYLFSLSLSLCLFHSLCELSFFEILKILICINYGVSVSMHAFICLYVCTCACVCECVRVCV